MGRIAFPDKDGIVRQGLNDNQIVQFSQQWSRLLKRGFQQFRAAQI
jgi:hypothetical protein